MERDGADRLARNPFWVLGVAPETPAAAVEREGQKLLGMLQLGLAAATTYTSPLGIRPRTADGVREALAALRDPTTRAEWELWAKLPSPRATPPLPRWVGALRAGGFS